MVGRFLGREEAAQIIGVSMTQLHRMDKEADPPPWTGRGYECKQFGAWLRRQFRREAGITDDGEVYHYSTERARLTKAQADKTELESQELRGEMVRVEEVIDEWHRQTGAAKSRCLSIPSKAAPRARTAKSDEEAARIIEAEVLEALEELSDDGLPSRTRARRHRRPSGVEAAPKADGKRVGRRLPAPKPRVRRRARTLEN